jgi:hypothetical protein
VNLPSVLDRLADNRKTLLDNRVLDFAKSLAACSPKFARELRRDGFGIEFSVPCNAGPSASREFRLDRRSAQGPVRVSGFHRETTTDSDGAFRFTNVPFNPYHMVAGAPGFAKYTQNVDVRSTVPISTPITLKIGAAQANVTVEANGGDLIENDSTFHTDVDQGIIDRLPLESQSSSVSSLVTLVTPGVAADSNGLFHGLGDHASNSFSVDGQPITDQQSKVFSNQVPSDSIQSLEVISGAPPAEFGGKTSLVIKVTTKSGLGVTTPMGNVTLSYGSFGTASAGFNLAYGGAKWGNFVSLNGLNTGRFLDPPEFTVTHAKGNEENVFDRVDYQLAPRIPST